MHSCNRAEIKPGNTVLIGGAGPIGIFNNNWLNKFFFNLIIFHLKIGLFTLLVAKAYGGKVYITGN